MLRDPPTLTPTLTRPSPAQATTVHFPSVWMCCSGLSCSETLRVAWGPGLFHSQKLPGHRVGGSGLHPSHGSAVLRDGAPWAGAPAGCREQCCRAQHSPVLWGLGLEELGHRAARLTLPRPRRLPRPFLSSSRRGPAGAEPEGPSPQLHLLGVGLRGGAQLYPVPFLRCSMCPKERNPIASAAQSRQRGHCRVRVGSWEGRPPPKWNLDQKLPKRISSKWIKKSLF